MKKIYNQFFTRILALAFGILCVSSLSAQYVIVNNADDTTGLQIADIGQFSGDLTTGTIVAVDDVCSGVPASAAGGIVVADITYTIGTDDNGNPYIIYSECEAADVVIDAQNAGAIAVILCNTDAAQTIPAHIYPRTSASSSATGGFDANLPTFGLTLEECTELKIFAGSEASLELLVPECVDAMPDNIVWGANGEGQFDGGLGDWTIDNQNGFKYSPYGKLDAGAYNNNQTQIFSPSLCNGAVVADASFGDNAGIPGNFLGGLCPSDGTVYCETSLISPVIDLSGVTEGVFLEFFQAVRQFNSIFSYQISTDGGATYGEEIALNSTLATNGNHIQENVSVPLFGAQGEANVRFKINYQGYYYYWAIDDVYLVSNEVADVRINSNFVAQVPSYRTPSSQMDIVALLADLENVGNVPAENVTLTATMRDSDNTTLATTSLDYGSIPAGFIDQNRLMDEQFDMPTDVGTYSLTYSLSSDNDGDASNDIQALEFQITDNVFAKCTPESATAAISFPNQPYQTLANAYYVTNATDSNGEQLYIDKVRVGVSDNGITGTLDVVVYQWIDANNNQAVDDNDGAPERFKVGSESIFVLDASSAGDIEVEIRDEDGELIPLVADVNYVVAVHTTPTTADTDQFLYFAAGTDANPNFAYGAMGFAFGAGSSDGFFYDDNGNILVDANGNTVLGTITENPLNMTRVGSLGGNGASGDEDERVLGQVNNFTFLAEMHIGTSGDIIDGTEDINENIKVSVFPNPAVENVYVDLALENLSKVVNLQVVDIQGKVVKTQNFNNVKENKLQLNVADLNTGVYTINIRTEEGFTSTRFIKG